jgi:flavin-dependent dehydrogenase
MTGKILVAGGGLAGAAAAITLAQAGRAVTLIERHSAPVHKICGEFCSIETQKYLARLGIDAAALGGQKISHVRLLRGSHVVAAKLPFEGIGLTRKTLDEALLACAARAGAVVERGQAIRQITLRPEISVEMDGGATHHPEVLLLATGKHEARGVARLATPSDYVGFKTYFALSPGQQRELAGHVELYLYPGGYAGLQMVEAGQANFCILVSAKILQRAGGRWRDVLQHLQAVNPQLAVRLENATELLAAPLSIARIPYGFIHRPARDSTQTQCYRLGDQAAVIPSFTGDGMAIALHSAALATQFLRRGQNPAAYHRQLAADVSGQIRRAGVLHSLLSAPFISPALVASAKIFPQALAISAAMTRVPARALLC